MKSPIQQIIDQLESVKRKDPKSAIYNLKKVATELLDEEREMVADAWKAGNTEGWEMTSDWSEDGEKYYDQKFKRKS